MPRKKNSPTELSDEALEGVSGGGHPGSKDPPALTDVLMEYVRDNPGVVKPKKYFIVLPGPGVSGDSTKH